jgi:hypothetical protein
MKYDTSNQWYLLTSGNQKGQVVRSFNAETEKYKSKGEDVNDIGWSNGITHCKDAYGCFVMFCGVDRFEEIATECDKPHELNLSSETKENIMNLADKTRKAHSIYCGSPDLTVLYKCSDGEIFEEENTAVTHEHVVKVCDLFNTGEIAFDDMVAILAQLRRYHVGEIAI